MRQALARQTLIRLAKKSVPEVMTVIGASYTAGRFGFPKRVEEGEKYLRLASQGGDLTATTLIGMLAYIRAIYERDSSLKEQNAALAYQYFSKVADIGEPQSISALVKIFPSSFPSIHIPEDKKKLWEQRLDQINRKRDK
jgi:hypothetical protein